MNTKVYLDRIGINTEIKPSLESLCLLQKQHVLHIPFENFDIHTNQKIELAIDRIYEKIVHNYRGGFCYELNGLFFELLQRIGFDVRRISGRVFHEGSYGKEFDHLAIITTIDDKDYLTDVGFGEFAFHPLQCRFDEVLEDARGIFKFDKYQNDYIRVSKRVNEDWVPEYIYKDIPRKFDDFKSMCVYHQTNANSHFTQKKFISIPKLDGRMTISNNRLKVTKDEEIAEKDLSHVEIQAMLTTHFNFKITKN